MKHLLAGILVCVIWGLCSCQSDGKVIIPSPIYVDNHYHGPPQTGVESSFKVTNI